MGLSNHGLEQKMTDNGGQATPELMTEAELVIFLRIPEIGKSRDHHNVIESLKRMRRLPPIHARRGPVDSREAITMRRSIPESHGP